MPSIHQPTTRDTGASRKVTLVREFEQDLTEIATALARRDFRKNGSTDREIVITPAHYTAAKRAYIEKPKPTPTRVISVVANPVAGVFGGLCFEKAVAEGGKWVYFCCICAVVVAVCSLFQFFYGD